MKLSQLMTLVRDKAVIAMIDNLLASLGRVALSRPPSPHSTISEIISGGLSAREGSVAWLQTPAAAQQTAAHLAPGLSADMYLLCNYLIHF